MPPPRAALAVLVLTVPGGVALPAAADVLVPADRTPPDVVLALDGGRPPSGWSRGPAVVRVAATDDGSGVVAVVTRIGDRPVVRTPGAAASLVLAGDGEHDVTAWAEDGAGHRSPPASTTVRVDRTAPRADLALRPGTAGAAATALDLGSGLRTAHLRHEHDGVAVPVRGLHAPLTAPGAHRVVLEVQDLAGNTARAAVEVVVAPQPRSPRHR